MTILSYLKKGIELVIGVFFHDNGSLMSYNEFLDIYNLPNVYMMQFNSIISAIYTFLKSVSVEKNALKTCNLFHTNIF